MATGTFTFNALCTKALKGHIKTQRNIVSYSKSNAVSVGMTAIKPCLSFYMPSGLSLVHKVHVLLW